MVGLMSVKYATGSYPLIASPSADVLTGDMSELLAQDKKASGRITANSKAFVRKNIYTAMSLSTFQNKSGLLRHLAL